MRDEHERRGEVGLEHGVEDENVVGDDIEP
jgi:hypothetical protein